MYHKTNLKTQIPQDNKTLFSSHNKIPYFQKTSIVQWEWVAQQEHAAHTYMMPQGSNKKQDCV